MGIKLFIHIKIRENHPQVPFELTQKYVYCFTMLKVQQKHRGLYPLKKRFWLQVSKNIYIYILEFNNNHSIIKSYALEQHVRIRF